MGVRVGGEGGGGWKFLVTDFFFSQKRGPGVIKRQKK